MYYVVSAGANWIDPDLTEMGMCELTHANSTAARLARECHWSVGWACALRHEALAIEIRYRHNLQRLEWLRGSQECY